MCRKKHNDATTAVQHLRKSHLELQTTNWLTLCSFEKQNLSFLKTLWSGSPRPTIYCLHRLVKNECWQQPHLDQTIHHALHVRFCMNTCRNADQSRNVYFSAIATGKREHQPRKNSAQTRIRRRNATCVCVRAY